MLFERDVRVDFAMHLSQLDMEVHTNGVVPLLKSVIFDQFSDWICFCFSCVVRLLKPD